MTPDMNLWEYLEAREEEIVRLRKELHEELQALREARSSLESGQNTKQSSDQGEKLTIKDMIRSVLTHKVDGGTSDQIIHWINKLHGTEVARTSLSPQLSRLKVDGEVELLEETGVWRLSHGYRRDLKRRAMSSAIDKGLSHVVFSEKHKGGQNY